jgi:hypothetical protein
MNGDWRKTLFYVSAVYDGVLGLSFLFLWRWLFDFFGVTPVNHGGYVQFPGLLLVIFAFLFLRIARDPDANRDLIVYGIALKASYCGLVFWYQVTTGVPAMWIPFAWLDLVFMALFVLARRSAPRTVARHAMG